VMKNDTKRRKDSLMVLRMVIIKKLVQLTHAIIVLEQKSSNDLGEGDVISGDIFGGQFPEFTRSICS